MAVKRNQFDIYIVLHHLNHDSSTYPMVRAYVLTSNSFVRYNPETNQTAVVIGLCSPFFHA